MAHYRKFLGEKLSSLSDISSTHTYVVMGGSQSHQRHRHPSHLKLPDLMTKITFISPDTKQHTVTATNGESLMDAAVDNDIPGIDADCGGSCACATCHVPGPRRLYERGIPHG